MAIAFNGSINMGLTGNNTLSGEETGTLQAAQTVQKSFSLGAVPPAVEGGGIASGSFTAPVSGTTLSLASTTNIRVTGGTGTFKPQQGYNPTGKRLRAMMLENTSLTDGEHVDVTIPSAGGLLGLVWAASAHIVRLHPLAGAATFFFPDGSDPLTAGTNDGLKCAAAVGEPAVRATFLYG